MNKEFRPNPILSTFIRLIDNINRHPYETPGYRKNPTVKEINRLIDTGCCPSNQINTLLRSIPPKYWEDIEFVKYILPKLLLVDVIETDKMSNLHGNRPSDNTTVIVNPSSPNQPYKLYTTLNAIDKLPLSILKQWSKVDVFFERRTWTTKDIRIELCNHARDTLDKRQKKSHTYPVFLGLQ